MELSYGENGSVLRRADCSVTPGESVADDAGFSRRYVTHSAEETAQLAAAVAPLLESGDMVLLDGPLGAGKTTFVQGIARAMGYAQDVTSPTFALAHYYRHDTGDTSKGNRGMLVHVDLYRMQSPAELLDLALDEEMDSGAVVFVEWGGEGLAVLRPDHLDVTILPDAEYSERTIVFSSNSAGWQDRIATVAGALSQWEI